MLQNTGKFKTDKSSTFQSIQEDLTDVRIRTALENDAIDNRYGFSRIRDKRERTGYLINMHTTEVLDESKRLLAAVDYYFMEEDGSRFKVSLPFRPYFYVLVKKDNIREVTQFLSKKYLGLISELLTVTKEDLDLPNHLIGLKQRYIKLLFTNMTDLIKVRREILSAVRKNRERAKTNTVYTEMLTNHLSNDDIKNSTNKKLTDCVEHIIDIREYDVPYHVRVSIDHEIFCGSWYTVQGAGSTVAVPVFTKRDDLIERPDPIVLAFDIETTKLPLKFPDAATDQIMMISYMIDGQGYLITNREIISKDVEDFEYTPNLEFEGQFTIFNEKDEAHLLQKFFDHIMDIRPHVFVTYNGDFFDWPFVETRAAFHNFDMKKEIGFSKNSEGVYSCRAAMHMDCLCWVKRDSYLPVGSQGLKAVAKAKLRYDPVELDPEEMCTLAVSQPQVLSNYSVSDAVATYYLYMKYVHPFIFALCTIIPMEPDEVLRKGSGTLCETLLMVEAFRANIIFPNKQENVFNKLTEDGHLLDQETYVGGHVEALESGVFRADLPCRFRLIPEAFDKLLAKVEHTLKYAIEVEEGIPLDLVKNFDEIVNEVKEKLVSLKSAPNRLENPIIYHLDVGAMYPNIILTNRLQPSAIVEEYVCAACDFNKIDARCKRNMPWMWRGEMMPASRNELVRIRQQLELEKFPPKFPNGPQRAFHQLSIEEQATYEKKRLTDYCRKAYNKTKVTKIEKRVTTVCQKENSFYVDTVRAFRDRRYEYKGLSKKSKQQVTEAIKKGNAEEIKSAKNREVLYDSLQLAHKCILNSFYGYVMRRGARWHSMEMGGIVCYTGANIIMKAREIIEQVGRPLELDTDGIWCVLPASFPDTFTVHTSHAKKAKVNISYPNAMLNAMVKDHFTNDQYHQLTDPENRTYEIRNENSVFFEVDGPYLAMVLPASKEEGKKLKKRYAVFNFDGSLAELKGFEVKRRGELQLIKNFQSSVFEAFLKGKTLEECYASVANVADYWLDVLYSKGSYMPDSELFELISENRSMSKTLEEYGTQKSTSISTAKRLAEFLGDEMVKDKGLACKFVISKKPEGFPVTDRAVPLAIFQTEPSIKRHYLRKWLKDSSVGDADIREVLDWNYYIERLGGTIQKIITIPAALQGISNPVPRIQHPDWLQKRLLEKNDVLRQRKINEIFTRQEKTNEPRDIEDLTSNENLPSSRGRPVAVINKRKRNNSEEAVDLESLSKSWREVLGPPPPFGKTKEEKTAWIVYQKKKWAWQARQRGHSQKNKRIRDEESNISVVRANTTTLGGFLRKAQNTLLNAPWQIVQICETNEPGVFKVWALVGQELHQVRLTVPRTFFVNQRSPKTGDNGQETAAGETWKKCNRVLPRSRPVHHLYQYSVPENIFMKSMRHLLTDLSTPDIEGIYETQMTLEFRALVQIGCICQVIKTQSASGDPGGNVSFSLDQLQFRTVGHQPYLEKLPDGSSPLKRIYLYHYHATVGHKAMFGLFLTPSHRALIIVLDTVRTNQLPNMTSLYTAERSYKLKRGKEESDLPPSNNLKFDIHVETELRQVYRIIQRTLQAYKDEKRGPTLLAAQTTIELSTIATQIPCLTDFPVVRLNVRDVDTLYSTLDWQRVGARAMVRHYLNSDNLINLIIEQCRYFHAPIGNLPADPTIFGADLFFARNLQKHNFVLWCSSNEKPDLGGREADDNSLLTEIDESASATINNPGCYSSVCVELDIDGLAVSTLLQSHRIHEADGTNSCVAFDNLLQQQSLEEMLGTGTPVTPLPSYDETALCSPAFKILRSMANAWLRDLTLYKNVFADFQIVHFYRWLRSPQALLYDPALRRTLHNLMNKLFLQLIAELKRLGAVIVSANFNRIVICTKKRTVESAIEYTEFVVRNVRNKDLFHSIDLSFNQCWEYLLWLDPVNFGGVKGKLSHEVANNKDMSEEGTENTEENEGNLDDHANKDDDMPEIIMNWNMAEYLPEEAMCQSHFNTTIASYISAVYNHLRFSGALTASTPEPRELLLNSQGDVSSQLPSYGLVTPNSVINFCKKFITGKMSQKLFALVQKIHYQQPECEAPEVLRISGHKHVNPALELIKALHRALSLDSSVQDEVDSLRRNMLQLIKVGAFSTSAEWVEPCTSFLLREVICKACNHCRDIELLKDNYRDIENERLVCKCPLCNTNYDNTEIEYLIIDALKRKAMSYTLQDLQCKKCSQIKFDNMSERCDCAGNFKTIISREELIHTIKTFRIIAKMFEMPLLEETINWTLSLCE